MRLIIKARGKKAQIGAHSEHGGKPVIKTAEGWKPRTELRVPGAKRQLDDPKYIAYVRKRLSKQPPGQGGPVAIQSEQELDAVLRHTKVAFISAGINPNDPKDAALGPNALAIRQAELKNDLKDLGYRFTKALGKYEGMKESSLIVMTHDADRHDMVGLGNKYNQDAVLFTENGHNEMLITSGEKAGQVDATGDGYEMTPGSTDFYTEIIVKGRKTRFAMALEWGKSMGMAVRAYIRTWV